MRIFISVTLLTSMFCCIFCGSIYAQNGTYRSSQSGILYADNDAEEEGGLKKLLPETKISHVWYLAYASGEDKGVNYNQFFLNRGYINIVTKVNSFITTRITPDLTYDREGDGRGDVEMRLKYIYIKFNFPSTSFITKPGIEFGMVHRPWLDFEEHINYYRSQGTMYMERSHLFNSADQGVSFFALLGGEMDETYKKTVNSSYPGKYGSISFGLYNGGGYHALEENESKSVEGRLTIRPLPEVIPGLQLTYFGVAGKGNTAIEPDWSVNTGFVSLEHMRYVLTGTYYTGKGNSKGNALTILGDARKQDGYSLFGELKIPESRLSLIGRYDYFNNDTEQKDYKTKRTIAGLVYHFQGRNAAILDYDTVTNTLTDEKSSAVKFTIEVHF